MKNVRKLKDYKQFIRALELVEQLKRECPSVSIISNCHINMYELKKNTYLFGVLDFNFLNNKIKAIIVPDKSRKYIVFNNNYVTGKSIKNK